ncbi:MAG: molecular chaperone Tir [Corynebacterium sp.]|nr:molecular chaperone Tir [Corynebacterium sp.]
MSAWKENNGIDFDFINSHDIYTAHDTSLSDTIKRRLRERLKNTKQVILLGSPTARRKGSDGHSFLAYEVNAIISLKLPVIVANLDKNRKKVYGNMPKPLIDENYYTISVPYDYRIIKYALDNYVPNFSIENKKGAYHYEDWVYQKLGIC